MRNCKTSSIKIFYDGVEQEGLLLGLLTAFIRPATNWDITYTISRGQFFQVIDFSILKYGFIVQKTILFTFSASTVWTHKFLRIYILKHKLWKCI